MTRRDQTVRAWIERENRKQPWQSMVSHKGKVHKKTTGTLHRRAAREFNQIHTVHILSVRSSGIPDTPPPQQTELSL